MRLRPISRLVLAVLLTSFGVVGCAPEDDGATGRVSCDKQSSVAEGQLPLKTPGKVTVATDDPAYAPWFQDDDPANGKGFESALAYAIAGELGFSKDEVVWVRVPFSNAYAPGPKNFDFDVNQVSITEARRAAVDFSTGYYQVSQVVVEMRGREADASLAQLAQRKVGVVVGTTSAQTLGQAVKPVQQLAYYDTNDLAVQALLAGQIDALVVDLPTGFQIQASRHTQDSYPTVIGKLPELGAAKTAEQFGLVFEKGSRLTSCVDDALARLRQKKRLAELEERWLGSGVLVPTLA